MNRYETIISLGEAFMKLINKGLIPIHILDWKVYYEAYVEEMEYQKKYFNKPKKTSAAGITAEKYKVTERTIFNVIAFMENK
ncbi:hypothetical protein [Flavobacterium sp. MK4S-17]|uniref:hypothetical protein n=1 Tax=Flavobacterium sp. MK4S-17 TaxID=2543737 RepID=UPI0013579365|nr:hypothetical protein [Flavobacterium sp. MK4S-17]